MVSKAPRKASKRRTEKNPFSLVAKRWLVILARTLPMEKWRQKLNSVRVMKEGEVRKWNHRV